MRKKLPVLLSVVLTLSLIAAPSFASVKAGAKCTKAGTTATAAGKKFTCIKSGKRLVWNKGVTIKASSKPVQAPAKVLPAVPSTDVPRQPEQKREVKNLLALDPRVSKISDLTSVDLCETPDQTPDMKPGGVSEHRNGFPRPLSTAYGKKSARVLVVPMSFNDLPFRAERTSGGQNSKSDLEVLNEVIPIVKDSFKKVSAGRFEIEIDVLPQSEWWVFNQNNPVVIGPQINNFPKVMDLVATQKSTFKFDVYDSYIFITGVGVPGQPGIGAGQAQFGEKNKNGKDGKFNAVLMTGIWTNSGIWVHELGHSLYAFEDLYLFDQTMAPGAALGMEVPTRWDLMANADLLELLGWNKLLMGWIEESEVRCISEQKTSVHYLTSAGNSDGSKLLTINLAPGVTLAAEARNSSSTNSGLLLYLINTNTNHGQGPVLTQRFLMSKGEAKSLLGWRISVLETDADGVLLEAVKTDIDKFVPPPPRPQQGNPMPPSSPIKVSKNEVAPNGFLKARATLEVQGHKSYRVYVTAADDYQKVYFESGYLNDDRTSLVVDMAGLVCGKPLRTMMEFYTERDAKGERFVVTNMQLTNLSCEDTTKKP